MRSKQFIAPFIGLVTTVYWEHYSYRVLIYHVFSFQMTADSKSFGR
jgi:hypothetical protein